MAVVTHLNLQDKQSPLTRYLILKTTRKMTSRRLSFHAPCPVLCTCNPLYPCPSRPGVSMYKTGGQPTPIPKKLPFVANEQCHVASVDMDHAPASRIIYVQSKRRPCSSTGGRHQASPEQSQFIRFPMSMRSLTVGERGCWYAEFMYSLIIGRRECTKEY